MRDRKAYWGCLTAPGRHRDRNFDFAQRGRMRDRVDRGVGCLPIQYRSGIVPLCAAERFLLSRLRRFVDRCRVVAMPQCQRGSRSGVFVRMASISAIAPVIFPIIAFASARIRAISPGKYAGMDDVAVFQKPDSVSIGKALGLLRRSFGIR